MPELKVNHILANGDCAILLQFDPSDHLQHAIHVLVKDFLHGQKLNKTQAKLINVIPATDSLVLVFATPIEFSHDLMQEITQRVDQVELQSNAVVFHEIPVCYDQSVAPDLIAVCELLNISQQKLIDYHTQVIYRVDMLGFLPGFAYLSGTHAALSLPRKSTPELQVEAGSIAIANHQTGIYSLQSPGGWYVIGRTPVVLLDWQKESQPMALNPLDEVQFRAVDLEEFYYLKGSYEH